MPKKRASYRSFRPRYHLPSLFSKIILAVLLTAIPVTVLALSQQREIRQRAAVVTDAFPKRWAVPNLIPDARGPENWQTFFDNEDAIKPFLNSLDVLELYQITLIQNPNQIVQKAVRLLLKYNKKLAVEGGYILCDGATAARAHISRFQVIYDAGGKLDYLTLDGPILNMTKPASLGGCGLTEAQAITELIEFMRIFHATHPETQMGIIVNFPNWGYDGKPGYFGPNPLLADYKLTLERILSAIAANGERLAFIHVDNPYNYAIGTANTPYTDVHSIDWMRRILQLEAQVKSHNLAFGIAFNTDLLASNLESAPNSDELYYNDTLAFINTYKERGGVVNDFIVQSWYKNPKTLLPSTQQYTFTNLYQAGLSAQGDYRIASIVPVYRLYNRFNSDHFYTGNPVERDQAVKSGYTLEGTAFYVRSTGGANLLPVYRLISKSSLHFLTSSEAEKDSLLKTGYRYEGIAFYAYPTSNSASNLIPVYRLFQTATGDHLYTISTAERDSAAKNNGYRLEGTAFYLPAKP